MQYNYEPFFDLELKSDYNTYYNNFKEDLYHDHHYREQENNGDPIQEEKYEEFVNGEKSKATKLFLNEYNQFVKDGIYFYGCPHELYLKTYEVRLYDFLKYYPEASEMHFIKSELEKGIKNIKYFISDREEKNMSFALEKRYNYLFQRSSQLGYDVTLIPGKKYADDTFKINRDLKNQVDKFEKCADRKLKTKMINVQYSELIKALIEHKVFDAALTEKEIFEKFSWFFDFEIDQTKGIRNITERVDNARFLESLIDTLDTYLDNKEEKKRYN